MAKSYDSVFGVDKHIHVPGLFSGMLSDINTDVAEALISMGDNQVVKKTTQTPTPPQEQP